MFEDKGQGKPLKASEMRSTKIVKRINIEREIAT